MRRLAKSFGDPLTPTEHMDLGVVYEDEGRLDEALEHYTAASRSLHTAPPLTNMGNICMMNGNLRVAESHYRAALKRDPNYAPALNNLAWLLYQRDSDSAISPEAELLAERAVALEPDNADYADTLAQIRHAPAYFLKQ